MIKTQTNTSIRGLKLVINNRLEISSLVEMTVRTSGGRDEDVSPVDAEIPYTALHGAILSLE